MLDLTLIILAAGTSSRFDIPVKKQWLRIDKEPLWLFVAKRFEKTNLFKKIIITSHEDEYHYMKQFDSFEIVTGGNTRQESMKKALSLVDSEYTLVSDVARSCFEVESLKELIKYHNLADVIVPYLPVSDTVVYKNDTINRDDIKLIQTPQLSKTNVLKNSLEQNGDFTDDSSAIVNNGGTRYFVEGKNSAHKLTFAKDLKYLKCLQSPSNDTFVGYGFDVHGFEDNKPMVLGGVKIESSFGFKAHSDGDVLIHSLIDAILGATGIGDIGTLFPDNDNSYKNIDSTILLEKTVDMVYKFGYIINNADITIMAQTPRLEKYKTDIKRKISKLLQLDSYQVNIKATTTEKLGFIGRKEGVGVSSIVSMKFYDWKL